MSHSIKEKFGFKKKLNFMLILAALSNQHIKLANVNTLADVSGKMMRTITNIINEVGVDGLKKIIKGEAL